MNLFSKTSLMKYMGATLLVAVMSCALWVQPSRSVPIEPDYVPDPTVLPNVNVTPDTDTGTTGTGTTGTGTTGTGTTGTGTTGTGTTGTGTGTTGTGFGPSGSNTTSLGREKSTMCNEQIATAYDNGRQQALLARMAKQEAYFNYSVSAAMAAQCIGKLVDYAQQVYKAMGDLATIATSADLASAAVQVLATRIFDAILTNLIMQLNNQICAITNEILSYVDSVVQNAICIPHGQLGPLSFSPLNLNLPQATCDGVAFNPLGFINAARGVTPADMYNTQLQGTAVDPRTAIMGSVAQIDLRYPSFNVYPSGPMGETPSFRTGTYMEDLGWLDMDQGTDVSVATTGNGVAGNSGLDIDAAVRWLTEHAEPESTGWCAMYVRKALEAGGLNTNGHPDVAKEYAAFLMSRGFSMVSPDNYVPQAGDIIVEQPYPGGKPAGHIAMYNGNQWISDFPQRDMFGGPGYRQYKNYVILRP